MGKKKLYAGFSGAGSLPERCEKSVLSGADGIVLIDLSENDGEHDAFIGKIRECVRLIECPLISGGRVKRLEDVKKYIYAGSEAVYLDASAEGNAELVKQAVERFGKNRIYMYFNDRAQLQKLPGMMKDGISGVIIDTDFISPEQFVCPEDFNGEVILTCSGQQDKIRTCLGISSCTSVMLMQENDAAADFTALKNDLKKDGFQLHTLECSTGWESIKTGPDGLLPVVVQDYRNSDVLMVAYMNREAFKKTIESGRMTYWSRSRQKLWLKGETSGHFQYVKSLTLDCDNDTLLARVFQVGAACHTGSRSCFFNRILSGTDSVKNPYTVLEDLYRVVSDRKVHPKEGSYTNYLFDKGIDKILKKVGEEATEIVIAAKNPDPEEIKYEISDFLYHMTVLMAEKKVTWDDITQELSNREKHE